MGHSSTVELSVFQKYAHFFWIPSFPLGKAALNQCSHSKQVLKQKENKNKSKGSQVIERVCGSVRGIQSEGERRGLEGDRISERKVR